jgi:hypothetical protein
VKTEGLPLKSHQMNGLQGNVGTYVGTVTGSCHRGWSFFSALGDVVFIPRDGLMATFAFSLCWLFCGFAGL